jgi:hypothetical protein
MPVWPLWPCMFQYRGYRVIFNNVSLTSISVFIIASLVVVPNATCEVLPSLKTVMISCVAWVENDEVKDSTSFEVLLGKTTKHVNRFQLILLST